MSDATKNRFSRLAACLALIALLAGSALWLGRHSVQAQEQKQKISPSELKLGEIPVGKILYLGNSITLHAPLEEIGWSGNWGMAASCEEADYVHLLTSRIAEAVGGRPTIQVRNIAGFERQFDSYSIAEELKEELEFQPDLVVLAIGENVPPLDSDELKVAYYTAFQKLVHAVRDAGAKTIVVRTSFYPDAIKDGVMKAVADCEKCLKVDIQELAADPDNMASSERVIEHAGVAAHPGDRGMQAIAEAIWQVLKPSEK